MLTTSNKVQQGGARGKQPLETNATFIAPAHLHVRAHLARLGTAFLCRTRHAVDLGTFVFYTYPAATISLPCGKHPGRPAKGNGYTTSSIICAGLHKPAARARPPSREGQVARSSREGWAVQQRGPSCPAERVRLPRGEGQADQQRGVVTDAMLPDLLQAECCTLSCNLSQRMRGTGCDQHICNCKAGQSACVRYKRGIPYEAHQTGRCIDETRDETSAYYNSIHQTRNTCIALPVVLSGAMRCAARHPLKRTRGGSTRLAHLAASSKCRVRTRGFNSG